MNKLPACPQLAIPGGVFPWPTWQPTPGTSVPDSGSSWGMVTAMTWPDLTLPERAVAMFIGDGGGGPGNEESLAEALGITTDELIEILWTLNRKGFLLAVSGWWAE